MPIIPVILSGGAGSRLWPASREGYPKPFMKLPDGESLLLKSYRRAMAVAGALGGDTLLTVTNRDYYFMSRDVLAEAGIDEAKNRFLLEPFARNTAPAIALAAHQIVEAYGRDALMLVLPADHLIRDQAAFVAAVVRAAECAQQQELVAFGITPTHPETGFGYIEAGEPLNSGRKVVRFVEKPSLEKARDYLAKGNFLWNSGMFCFQAGVMLDEITRHAPQVATATQAAWNAMLDKRKAE
ncbi:MAG: NTP transferase domain-containing protein, partial [Zoogloeaceae bacterium]|nr:NTP transferase domain-containing protein [Zoogloeaceae bacterium]